MVEEIGEGLEACGGSVFESGGEVDSEVGGRGRFVDGDLGGVFGGAEEAPEPVKGGGDGFIGSRGGWRGEGEGLGDEDVGLQVGEGEIGGGWETWRVGLVRRMRHEEMGKSAKR